MQVEHEGFEELFRKEFPIVVGTVTRIVGDREAAIDLTQDAFAEALVRWRKVQHLDRPGAWVRRVAIRRAVRHRPHALATTEPHARDLPAPFDPGLVAAVNALAPMQRAAVVLFYLEDRSVAEVADLLGCAEATVRVHLHRARAHLRSALDEGADA